MLFSGVRLAPDEPCQDVRVAGGLVTEVGDLRPEGGEEVLEGGALLPGFVDAHVHLATWAATLERLDVSSARTALEAAEAVRAAPAARTAYGFRDALWPDRPHKDLLQQVAPDRAVVLLSADLHTLWLSPAMLAELEVEHETGVVRDEEGLALLARLDAPTPDDAVVEATAELARRGITGVLDFEYADNRTDWLRRPEPLVRVSATVWTPWLEQATERTGEQLAPRVRQGPLKVMVDGSLNTRTAACHDPYPDPADGRGQLYVEPEELVAVMARAWRRGISTAAHAIGDRAVGVVLDAFERVGCPGRVEHAQQVRPQDLSRLRRPGLVAGVQPQHAMDDRDVVDVHWPDRTSLAFAYGSLHRAGVTLQLGSDAPVSPPSPLDAVSDAVTRTADDRPPYLPDEALPPDVALRAACGGRGRIAAGEVADLVHLEEHPLLLSGQDVRAIGVRTTVLAGSITHRRD